MTSAIRVGKLDQYECNQTKNAYVMQSLFAECLKGNQHAA